MSRYDAFSKLHPEIEGIIRIIGRPSHKGGTPLAGLASATKLLSSRSAVSMFRALAENCLRRLGKSVNEAIGKDFK